MELTFAGYYKMLSSDLQSIPFKGLLFFGAWSTERLLHKYGGHLKEIAGIDLYIDIKNMMGFLWNSVDHPQTIDAGLAGDYLGKVQDIYIDDNLDITATKDCGMAKLLSSLENTLAFLYTRDSNLIVEAAFFPLDVIDCILTNELELNTANPDKHIDHPLLQEEFNAQLNLVTSLKANETLTSNNKDIYSRYDV
jgi:hypothetical protein